jgi:hypothetical protein
MEDSLEDGGKAKNGRTGIADVDRAEEVHTAGWATWKKIPDKWAPCGSVCGEYGRRAHARIFSETQINLQFDFTFV